MKDIEEVVKKCCQQVLDDSGLKIVSDINMRMTRENGIDSLGMVTLILSIEEELEVELDYYLSEMRNAEYLRDFINIVKKAREKLDTY